ncbi:MAG: M1 family metallopeptidase [Clostridiales bacterium]|nr:M1 family metallopeptidase [Clostridiales bacterium]
MKLKKYLLSILIPIVLFSSLLVGCKSSELEKISKELSHYTMDIEYYDNHTISVSQSLEYKNRTETSLDELKLHLYPQSFREGAKSTVISKLNYDKCYYNGRSYGDINITSLTLENQDCEVSLTGNDEDILSIPLTSSLAPDSTITLDIKYTVQIPNINHRFGYGEDAINIANFYPIMCMYENGDYIIDSYHYNGDPFYSDMANYDVNITIPTSLKLASTGSIISEIQQDSNTIYTIQAKAVRDFAFVLSDKFNIVSDNINNVKVSYFYYNNQYPNECLQAGIDAINTFNRLFGEYPYSTLNIVETDFVHGGMEYPNLVFISDTVDIQSDYINVIIHEVAHQWWYGLVGNDEYHYGWLDEGLTEYSTLLFYEENPNYNVDTKELIKNTTNSYVTFVDVYKKVFNNVDSSMNRKLNEYNNESEYVYIAYVKGMLLFDSLREILGDDKFSKGIQQYFTDNKYKISTPDQLISSFEKATGNNLREFFSSWIDGKVTIMQMN